MQKGLAVAMAKVRENCGAKLGTMRWHMSFAGEYDGNAAETLVSMPAILRQARSVPRCHREVPFFMRLAETIISLAALLLTAPMLITVALIIKAGTPGPILFFQKRVGLNGRLFTFVKFRTMYADARERFPELYAYKHTDEQLRSLHFKIEDDPRITPQGKWLRRSTLDELPNFWNVLKGDMALVGPRPEIPEMLPYYEKKMLLKFAVRPGITGLAQISGRGRLSYFDTVAYDLNYVRTRSLANDVKIILKTLYKIVVRDGAF
jgi:lipopolysaccharide/colanic/teichoic acid biosynthesis glycosyltransferase